MKIKIDAIHPNPKQPRHVFDQAEMANLVASIEQVGLINPIAVEDNGDQTYTLIDGERRWRACKQAGLKYIEAYVKSGRNGHRELLYFSPAIQEMFSTGSLPISTRLIYAIKRMPQDEHTDQLIARFASRRMTENKILAQLTLIEHASGRTGKKFPKAQLDPAQACEGALSMTANQHVPEILKTNVSAVCARCGMNSREICRNCPVTDLVDHWR